MLTTFQTKIDSIINQEYQNMPSQSHNEIISLIQYTKALDLFEFTSKFYHIQQTEIIVNVSLYWETLGNSKQALEYLNRALEIVPNQPSLVLYKSILLLSLNFPDESQRSLLRYKQLGRNNHCCIFYYDTFRIIFYYVLKYEDDVILSEINEFIAKYNNDNDNRLNGALGTIHYIRALIYSNCALKQKREEAKQLLIQKYEENINIAYKYQRSNTCYYIQEGIYRDNLSKAFTIIFPDINHYKPKMLMHYQSIFQGFKLFYVLFKAVKLFNIKLKRKKIKTYYIQQLKISKKAQSKERDCSSESHEGNAKSTKRNTCDDSMKNKSNNNILRCKGKNDSSSASDITDRNNSSVQCKRIEEIKNEFHTAIRNLYNSVWVHNYSIIPKQNANANDGVNIEVNAPLINSNYFIRNGYYSPRNIKENILKGISNNEDYKSKLNREQEKRVVSSHKANIKNTNKIINTINNTNTNNNNSNSNAKTEPSAPSQISTYSNGKTGEETTLKMHQHKSTKEIKKIKSNIPLQLNYHTEMKSHSNERMRNNKSPSINLIDVSDNNNNDNPQISVKKNELIISRRIKKKIINDKITKIDISSNNNRHSNNNQPPSIALGLKKNIPQSKAKPAILHLLSKKTSDINSNSSIEKYIKFRNIQSAHKYHMSLSKENAHSHITSTNCLNSNLTNQEKTYLKDNDKEKDCDISDKQKKSASKGMNISPKILTKPNPISSTSSHIHIEGTKITTIIKSNKDLFMKRKPIKERNALIRQKNSSTRKIGAQQIKYTFSVSSKKDNSSMSQLNN